MTSTYWIALIMSAGTIIAGTAQSQPNTPCAASSMPREIQSYLTRKFDGWRIKQASDLGPLALGNSKYLNLRCPGVAVGEFRPATGAVFALLLVPVARPHTAHQLVVFYRTPRTRDVHSEILDRLAPPDRGDSVISAVKLAEVFSAEYVRSLVSKEGIKITDPSGTFVYFWQDGKFRSEFLDE